jgi:hypothetical protein
MRGRSASGRRNDGGSCAQLVGSFGAMMLGGVDRELSCFGVVDFLQIRYGSQSPNQKWQRSVRRPLTTKLSNGIIKTILRISLSTFTGKSIVLNSTHIQGCIRYISLT